MGGDKESQKLIQVACGKVWSIIYNHLRSWKCQSEAIAKLWKSAEDGMVQTRPWSQEILIQSPPPLFFTTIASLSLRNKFATVIYLNAYSGWNVFYESHEWEIFHE